MKSKKWIQRNSQDIYVKKAKNEGYLSRSAYKLIQIDNKYKILKKSNKILELGSAPGGWSQVVCNFNKKVAIHSFDVLEMQFKHPQIKFFKKDFFKFDIQLLNKEYDLILSDIAPNTTGHQSTDHLRIACIVQDIIALLKLVSLPKGNFIFKIWKGSEEKSILNQLKKQYEKVSYYKPSSSRNESSEIFIVAENFIV